MSRRYRLGRPFLSGNSKAHASSTVIPSTAVMRARIYGFGFGLPSESYTFDLFSRMVPGGRLESERAGARFAPVGSASLRGGSVCFGGNRSTPSLRRIASSGGLLSAERNTPLGAVPLNTPLGAVPFQSTCSL